MTADPIRHLYLHIPFCPAKCPYCAFVTHVGSLKLVEPYLQALGQELDSHVASVLCGPLETVYLGGGTPSMLSGEQMARLMERVSRMAGIVSGAEITAEAHPDTVDPAKLREYRAAGINRISIGGESLDRAELGHIGRRHGPDGVLAALGMARDAGFENVSVDLMYGLPGQTLVSWTKTLNRLLAAAPDHISLYPLSIEPKTVFGLKARRGQLLLPEDEDVVSMYERACEMLSAAGYEHYEVANWARPGYSSRHNLAYWLNRENLAVGVGAHGYVKPYRTENMSGTRRYIDTILDGSSPVHHRELIDPSTEASESAMLGLRLLRDGLDLRAFGARHGAYARRQVEDIARGLTATDLLREHDDRLFLPEGLVPVANEIWQRFMSLKVETSAAA